MSSAASAAASGASPKRLFCGVGAGRHGRHGFRRFRLRGDADLQRIDVDRLGDVLELGRAEIRHRQVEPPFHLPIGLLGETDRAGLSDAFQPRSDVDPVAHEVAVALLDHIAHMDADAEFDAPVGRHAGIAFDHRVLQFDGAAYCVDDTAEFDDAAVAGALDDAAMMDGDRGVDQVAAKRSEPSEDAILVRPGEPAVADDVRHEDRRELPGLAHCAAPIDGRLAQNLTDLSWATPGDRKGQQDRVVDLETIASGTTDVRFLALPIRSQGGPRRGAQGRFHLFAKTPANGR